MKNLIAVFILVCSVFFASANTINPPANGDPGNFAIWWKVAAADAGGAFVGACEGSVFGPWGTAAGAVICGGAASIGASRVAPGAGGCTPIFPWPSKSANEMDYVGRMHNEIVCNYFSSNRTSDNFEAVVSIAKVSGGYGDEFYKLNFARLQELSLEVSKIDFSSAEANAALYDNGKMSKAATQFIVSRIQNAISSETIVSATSTIQKAELELVKQPFTTEEKNLINLTFATYKYSVNMWR
jgi:hypothetical protein